jgi:hypothetical protein
MNSTIRRFPVNVKTTAVVFHQKGYGVVPPQEDNASSVRMSVPHNILNGFLRNPVQGQFDLTWEPLDASGRARLIVNL